MSDPFRRREGGEKPEIVAISPPPSPLKPVSILPSGSQPGEACAVDMSRSVLAGVTSYGLFSGLAKVLATLGFYPQAFGRYGVEIAAVLTSLSALAIAWTRDNRPAIEAEIKTPPDTDGTT